MKKNLIYLSMLLVFLFAGSTIAQEAKKDCDHKGHGKLSHLDLTDDQQKQIDAIKTPHMKESLQLKNQIREKEAHLKTLESADKPDTNKINKTIDETAELKAQLHKKNAAYKQEVRKILTEEQRVKYDAHQGRNQGKMMHKPGEHGKKNMGKHKTHDCK